MNVSPQQKEFLIFLSKKETCTFDEAGQFFGGQYANQGHYISMALTRLVKRGLIERVKKGVYKLSEKPIAKASIQTNENQITLL